MRGSKFEPCTTGRKTNAVSGASGKSLRVRNESAKTIKPLCYEKTTCLINETPISGFTRPATQALIIAFTLMSLILAQEAAFAQNKNKSRLSAANAKLDSMLSERVQTSRLLNKCAKKEERNGKYSRRTSMGRLRSYTYDFQVGKFVCDPDEKHLLHPDTESCNPPYEIHEMDAVRIKIKNIKPFIYTVNLYELQGDRISNENLTEGNSSRSLLIDFKALGPISVEKVGLASSTDTTLMKQILKTEKLERDIAILTKRLNESMVMKDTRWFRLRFAAARPRLLILNPSSGFVSVVRVPLDKNVVSHGLANSASPHVLYGYY